MHDRSTGTTTLVSPGPVGFASDTPYLSPNGDWVVFLAEGALVPGDTNGVTDVYRYEVATGALTLVSLNETGGLGSMPCSGPIAISNSGDRVVFESASKLVTPDGNGEVDVFLRDLSQNKTIRAEGATEPVDGSSDPHISADGQCISFVSATPDFVPGDSNGLTDVFVWEPDTDTYSLVSVGLGGAGANGLSYGARLSRFGRYVVFASTATNLTIDNNAFADVFWFDRQTSSMVMVNVAADGTQANATSLSFPSVTQNGGIVAYQTFANNLVPGDTTNGAGQAMLAIQSSGALTFCTAKLNSLTCLPSIGASGSASAAQAQPFNVTAQKVMNNKNGLFFYGLNGAAALPFQGGTLCVFPPLKRTTIMNSLGNVGPDDCSGFYSFDFNAWMQGGNDVNLVVGREVNGQYWSRDPGSTFGVGLTNGVRFVICP